jgi:outer membrane protein TolC
LILNAYLEVENAIGSEKRLREQEKALRISLNEAQKAESRLELRYTEGLATILQLLDAQSRSLTAEGQLISSRKERLSNRVRLHVALGGGVELLKLSHSRDAQAFELEKKE